MGNTELYIPKFIQRQNRNYIVDYNHRYYIEFFHNITENIFKQCCDLDVHYTDKSNFQNSGHSSRTLYFQFHFVL